MSGAEELAARRADYEAAVQAERTRQLAKERVARLTEERDRAQERVDAMKAEATLEHEQAEDWAGKGFQQLLLWLFGRLDERRELEASQALAAATRLATAQSAMDEVERTLAEAQQQMPPTADVAGALAALRDTWAAVDPQGYEAAVALEAAAGEARAMLTEYDEAIVAVDRCVASARTAQERLGSAKAWGTYDIIGGGFISSAIKRERVSEALAAIESTTAGIAAVRRELADIPTAIAVPAGLEMGSGAWTFDVWFDNIFSDLNMQARIGEAAGKVEMLIATLGDTRNQLQKARAEAARHADEARAAAVAAFTA